MEFLRRFIHGKKAEEEWLATKTPFDVREDMQKSRGESEKLSIQHCPCEVAPLRMLDIAYTHCELSFQLLNT